MIYHHLFEKCRGNGDVYAAIIGAGHFGAAIAAQQKYTDQLCIPVVVDKDLEKAKKVLEMAEVPAEQIKYCSDAETAEEEVKKGNYVYTDKAEIPINMPSVGIICEATGSPEMGALYCKTAIEEGKNIALVNKELDSAVGPLLRKMAEDKGLICTPVDGDQPALLIEMVEWARTIGLTVISAGKSRDGEFIFDEETGEVSIAADGITIHQDYSIVVPEEDRKYLEMIPEGKSEEYLEKRQKLFAGLPGAGGFDLCEMTIVANSIGLPPACDSLSQGALRIMELPIVYCGKEHKGIYEKEGVVDIITCLRRKDESGMGGGVYLVVRCDNAYANYILTTKGQIANYDNTAAVIYRPYHLCGVEVSTTLLCAGLLKFPTSSHHYRPDYDLVRRAICDIPAGAEFGNDHDPRMESLIIPGTKRLPESPVPAHLLTGRRASTDIKAGQVITYSMVETPESSVLWDLRLEQEKLFG